MRKSIAAGVVTASVLTGGAIGLTLFGPSAVGAKTGTTTTPTTAAQATPAASAKQTDRPDRDHRGFGMHRGMRDDLSVASKAIGISESDLTTALRSGKTIAQVAKAHGVATQKVIDALVADAKTKIAAAVKAGRLTQVEANKVQTDLTRRVTGLVNGTMLRGPGGPIPGGPGFGGRGFGGPGFAGPGRPAAAAAKAIGISESDLTTALRSGKTIAQVAKAHGVATQKVIDALVADGKTKIAAAVKAGRITKAQADKIQAGLKQQTTDVVNGKFLHGRDHGDRRGSAAKPGWPNFDHPGA